MDYPMVAAIYHCQRTESDTTRLGTMLIQISSLCGYDHTSRGGNTHNVSRPFTGCLAHAEITYVVDTQQILRIRGYFKHNQECIDSVLSHIPRQRLHPSLFELTLTQLANGVPLTQIQKKNRDLVNQRAYPDIPDDRKHWKCRWLLERHDTRSLYCQFSRMNGVKMEEKPHFEVCIATKEMNEAAWKYGHKKQILLDRTFGLCDIIKIRRPGKAALTIPAPATEHLESSDESESSEDDFLPGDAEEFKFVRGSSTKFKVTWKIRYAL
ncbi:hypothetical protein C8J56DRAFT_881128 [Mycena floridula]|nr:hypothetical protein C8J56DRAFT_881128 [Mycena floridula]